MASLYYSQQGSLGTGWVRVTGMSAPKCKTAEQTEMTDPNGEVLTSTAKIKPSILDMESGLGFHCWNAT